MRFPRLLPALALAGFFALPLAGCDTAGPDPARNPPAVVARAAFDLSDAAFPQAANLQGGVGPTFTNAALRVGVVSLAVGFHLLVPTVATSAAAQAEPFVESGTWIWENTVPINDTDVTFRLEGTPEGQRVDWRMIISTDEELAGARYDGFVLYTGTTSLDGREGDWRLYYEIDGARTHVLSADFRATSDADRTLTFSIPETNPNEEARGSTVTYTRDGDAREFDWHQEPEAFDHLVEWSASSHAGALTATNYNGGARACWDASLQDVPCVPALVP
jgi:hypothetical protein